MEAGAAETAAGALRWRLWALGPILLLALVVGAVRVDRLVACST